jgi:serine/threonine protein kinase
MVRLARLNLAVHDPPTVLTDPPRPDVRPLPQAALDKTEDGLTFLEPPQDPAEVGRLGPYRILGVLGRGGMGVVFEADDTLLGRPVALKVMRPALALNEAAKQRFLREARAMARATAIANQDHVVTIYAVSIDAHGLPFLAMPLLRGETLETRLQREGRLPAAEVARVGREVALGLAAAHEQGIIHRDIKPSNVWLEAPSGRAKVMDFGLARAPGAGDQHLTQEGAILGTPAYMAPEQAHGEAIDGRCDLFSLGSVLYRAATGELPFKGKDSLSTLLALATQRPRPPRALNSGLPAALSDLILRLLARDPAGRPASARAVADALADLARPEAPLPDAVDEEESATAVLPTMPAPPAAPWLTPRRLLVVGVAAGLFALLATAVVFFAPAFWRGFTNPPN